MNEMKEKVGVIFRSLLTSIYQKALDRRSIQPAAIEEAYALAFKAAMSEDDMFERCMAEYREEGEEPKETHTSSFEGKTWGFLSDTLMAILVYHGLEAADVEKGTTVALKVRDAMDERGLSFKNDAYHVLLDFIVISGYHCGSTLEELLINAPLKIRNIVKKVLGKYWSSTQCQCVKFLFKEDRIENLQTEEAVTEAARIIDEMQLEAYNAYIDDLQLRLKEFGSEINPLVKRLLKECQEIVVKRNELVNRLRYC